MRLRLVVGRGPFDVVAFTPTHQPEEDRWIHEGWARTSSSQVPAYTECLPSQCQPRVSQYPAISKQQPGAIGRKTKTSFHQKYTDGTILARSSVWRYPSAEERELILAFRRRHTAAIFGKKRRLAAPSEYEDARLSVLGRAPHVGVMAFLIAHLFVDISILSELPPRNLVQVSARRAAVAANQPEEQLIRLLALQQTHRGREIRRPCHLDALVTGLNYVGGIGGESLPHRGGLQKSISMS